MKNSQIIKFKIVPRIITRSEHIISRVNIDDKALKVLYRLKNAGYKAYLVGGSVRDLLLGREPKDFDVATDALPEQIRELFRNCRLIGRRFRLAHVHFGGKVIEVATFRAQQGDDGGERVLGEGGRLVRDNVYGNIDEDAWRRDFTVNALYYNIEDFTVVDYVGGLEDIQAARLRLIGEPEQRFREDPVRLLRAVRFAVKLGFTVHADTEQSMFKLGYLLEQIPPARLFEEVLKLFMGGCAVQTFERLRHYGLFRYLFPQVEASLSEEEGGFPHLLLARTLENTDARIAQSKPVTPGFLFAALLWDPMRRLMGQYQANGLSVAEAMQLAVDVVISHQVARIAMPRRFTRVTREIWALQARFAQRGGKRPLRLLSHPRFRAAYDFLLLRAEVDEEMRELAGWWTEFQEADSSRRQAMQSALQRTPGRRLRR